MDSLRHLECAERRKWAAIWLGLATAVADVSELKLALICTSHAVSRLCLACVGFCSSPGFLAGAPSMSQVRFHHQSSRGLQADHVRCRRRSAVFASGLCHAHVLVEGPVECLGFSLPLIKAWREHGTSHPVRDSYQRSPTLDRRFAIYCMIPGGL